MITEKDRETRRGPWIIESDDELPPFVPLQRAPLGLIDAAGCAVVFVCVLMSMLALVIGFVEEGRFIGRLFR